MFIVTARVPKKKLLAGGVALLCCCVVAATAVILSAGGVAVAASAEVRGIRDNDDRVAYLNELGWTVSAEPIATEELLIPDHFDDTYSDYLALQEGQGFDLSRYCGKRVKRYTYEITNYPTGEAGFQVALLVYRSTVIGGEVLSPLPEVFSMVWPNRTPLLLPPPVPPPRLPKTKMPLPRKKI